MTSEQVVISAPFSFAGSAERIWKYSDNVCIQWLVLVPLIACAWSFILCWYMFFGFLVVPYRLIRRSSRKQKQARLRHAEMMEALQKK